MWVTCRLEEVRAGARRWSRACTTMHFYGWDMDEEGMKAGSTGSAIKI